MVHHWKTSSTVLKYGAPLEDRLHCSLVLKYGAPLEDRLHCPLVLKYGAPLEDRLHCFLVLKCGPRLEDMICLLASSAGAVCGRGQSELPAHVEVEVIVTGSKPDEDILFSCAEVVVVVLLCNRLVD